MARDYWKDRQAQALTNLSNKSAKSIEAQLKKYYAQTMQSTIKEFEATYDKLLATIEDGREPTPADLYKLDKYWQTQAQLKDELQKLGDKEAAVLSKQFENSYKDVYKELAKDSTAHYSRISTQGAQQMIKQVWAADGKSWSERIWDNTADLAETLNEKLIECVVGGKKTSDLKKALMERFNVSYNNADMLARTELAHIQTQAARQRYEDTGIERVQIWADKDERRCEVCAKLHKKIYPVGAQMPIPAHPRCRCTIIPVVDIPDEETTQQTPKTTQQAQTSQKDHNKTPITKQDVSQTEIAQPTPTTETRIILTQDGAIDKSKTIAEKLVANPELLDNGYKGYANIRCALNKELGYDAKPTVLGAAEFEAQAQGKTILYRGVHSGNGKSAKEIADEFRHGKLWAQNDGGAVYGRGVYFTANEHMAKNSYAGDGGDTITAFIASDAKVADYRELMTEYLKTGIPQIIGTAKEDYQEVIRDIGSYAAVKGYDAIALNGYQGHDYIVLLNRGKFVVKE